MTNSKKWLAFGFLALAQLMIVLDATIVNVALPSIKSQLGLSIESLQWIVTAYTLTFGGFLLLGGRAADLFGRRRMFATGVVGFTLTSLFLGFAPSVGFIVPLRALQGFFAAFTSPAALSLVLTIFNEQKERARALSLWGAIAAAGAVLGLVIGGFLTQYLSWRWNFFVNIPLGLLVISTLGLLPRHSEEERSRTLDISGAVLITSSLMLVVYVLSKANTWGWLSLHTLGVFALSAALLIGFLVNERVVKHPLVTFSVFRIKNILAANGVMFLMQGAFFSSIFFLALYTQGILHYSPFTAGLATAPIGILLGITAVLTPRAIGRFGYKWVLSVAPFFALAAFLWLARLPLDGRYVHDILPALLVLPVGFGLVVVSSIVAATAGIPPEESGLASGVISTAQQLGGSVGLAAVASVASAMTAEVLARGAVTPLAQASAALSGFHSAFYTAVWFAFGTSIVATLFIKKISRADEGLRRYRL